MDDAILRDCPACGAKAGEQCDDPGIPDEEKPGWHAARLEDRGPAVTYRTERTKPLAELRPSDVPHGVDPDDLATDLSPPAVLGYEGQSAADLLELAAGKNAFRKANPFVEGLYVLALSEYELVNLRELLRCCGYPDDGLPAPIPYNTGDWLGQVYEKLRQHPSKMAPNVTLEQMRSRDD